MKQKMNNEKIVAEPVESKDFKDSEEFKTLMDNEDFCETLAEVLHNEMQTDDEALDNIGRKMFRAIQTGGAEDMLLAIVGWKFETLVGKAKERYQEKQDGAQD